MTSRLLKGAASFAATVLLATALVLASRPAVAQQPPPAASQSFDFAARSKEVVAYVGGVIRFYQESTTPIQKVGEPNDIVYRDQAVALSTQAATLAFQFARAEAELMTAYQRHQGSSRPRPVRPKSRRWRR